MTGALAVYCAGDRVIARDSDYSVPGHPRHVHEDDGSLRDHPGPIRIGERVSVPGQNNTED